MEAYGMELAAHVLPLLALFFAAFMQSITGFGLVMIASPLLMLFYDAKLSIELMMLISFIGNLTQAILLHRDTNWRMIGWLVLGALVSQPIGYLIFITLPSNTLKIVVSVVILLAISFLQMLHPRLRITPRHSIAVGLIAGVMATTTGISGPPIALYFAYASMAPRELRANCISYFLLSNAVAIMTFVGGGIDMRPALHEFLYLLPALFVGIACGQAAFRYVPTKLFRRLIFALLYLTCIYSIWSAL